jgi:hypothetical protein
MYRPDEEDGTPAPGGASPPWFSSSDPAIAASSTQHRNMSSWFAINKNESLGDVGGPDVPLSARTQHRDLSPWCGKINKKTMGIGCVLAIVIIIIIATTNGNSNSMIPASTMTSDKVEELYGLPDDCVDGWADDCYVNGGTKIRCTCGDGTIWIRKGNNADWWILHKPTSSDSSNGN